MNRKSIELLAGRGAAAREYRHGISLGGHDLGAGVEEGGRR